MSPEKHEIIRRLRLGDLRRLLRSRYGPKLPDDDAGREDLRELLLPISLGPQASIRMPKAIEVHAPWMDQTEAAQLIDQIMRTPTRLRKPTARKLGQQQHVTNQQRELWKLWTIAPCDMTDTQMREHRKAKARAREQHRRRRAGSKPRGTYLDTHTIARNKPWEAEGKSRRTWYRQRANGRGTGPCEVQDGGGTGPCQLKLSTTEHGPVPPEKLKRRKRVAERRRLH